MKEKLIEELRRLADLTPPICQYDQPEDHEIFGKKITVYCKPFEQFQEVLRSAADALSADAVEVVRCKNCKWSEPGEWYSAGLLCTNPKCHKYIPHYEVPQTHFCSYGEKGDSG